MDEILQSHILDLVRNLLTQHMEQREAPYVVSATEIRNELYDRVTKALAALVADGLLIEQHTVNGVPLYSPRQFKLRKP